MISRKKKMKIKGYGSRQWNSPCHVGGTRGPLTGSEPVKVQCLYLPIQPTPQK